MKAYYDLRHKLYGGQGSLWERQVDAPTRQIIRAIVSAAGGAPLLAQLDQAASAALNSERVLVEDVYFQFTDGEFAVIGKKQREYSHRRVVMPDGTPIFAGYRSGVGDYSADPLVTKLARLSLKFVAKVDEDKDMFLADQSRDWYLVPVPPHILPIVIQGLNAGEYLVQGVDFLAFEGYIAMIDLPTLVMPRGVVKVNSAYVKTASVNRFVLSAPAQLTRSKWVADYTYKTQSLEAYKRAAAEYAGLYVFHSADVVLSAHAVGGVDTMVYATASAGAIEIAYPHVHLTPGQTVEPGYIVCQKFDLVTTRHASDEDLRKQMFSGWDHPITLDGILPVNGLTWDGVSEVMLTDGGTNPEPGPHNGKTHARLMFDGDTAVQERYWEFSALHERATGVFLHEELGEPSFPHSVDFWAMLHTFYGSRLALAVAADHGPAINSRLWRFLFEHRPKSCNILVSIKPLPL